MDLSLSWLVTLSGEKKRVYRKGSVCSGGWKMNGELKKTKKKSLDGVPEGAYIDISLTGVSGTPLEG